MACAHPAHKSISDSSKVLTPACGERMGVAWKSRKRAVQAQTADPDASSYDDDTCDTSTNHLSCVMTTKIGGIAISMDAAALADCEATIVASELCSNAGHSTDTLAPKVNRTCTSL